MAGNLGRVGSRCAEADVRSEPDGGEHRGTSRSALTNTKTCIQAAGQFGGRGVIMRCPVAPSMEKGSSVGRHPNHVRGKWRGFGAVPTMLCHSKAGRRDEGHRFKPQQTQWGPFQKPLRTGAICQSCTATLSRHERTSRYTAPKAMP